MAAPKHFRVNFTLKYIVLERVSITAADFRIVYVHLKSKHVNTHVLHKQKRNKLDCIVLYRTASVMGDLLIDS